MPPFGCNSSHACTAPPKPYHPGSIRRHCAQLKTHGIARRSSMRSDGFRDDGGLRENCLVAGAATAANRAAAAVEQAQLYVVTAEDFDQRDLRLVELPAGSQETAILVAVRIAEHDLLHAAATFQQARIFGEIQQLIHDAAAIA